MLHGFGARRPADVLKEGFADLSVRSADANLDQLVAFQGSVDVRQDCSRKPVAANQHHRVDGVRPSLQLAALGG